MKLAHKLTAGAAVIAFLLIQLSVSVTAAAVIQLPGNEAPSAATAFADEGSQKVLSERSFRDPLPNDVELEIMPEPGCKSKATGDTVVLDYDEHICASRTARLVSRLEKTPKKYLMNKSRLEVVGYTMFINYTAFPNVIKRLPNLKEVHWNSESRYSMAYIRQGDELTSDEMNFYLRSPYEANDMIKLDGTFLRSPNLYTLKAHIKYDDAYDPESILLIHNLITTNPGLRYLDLAFSYGHSCIIYSDPRAFNFTGNSTLATSSFPPLEHLKLAEYLLDAGYDGNSRWPYWYVPNPKWWHDKSEARWPYNKLPQWVLTDLISESLFKWMREPIEIDPCPLKRYCYYNFNRTTNLDGWLERMDFGNLRSLELDWVSNTAINKLWTKANLSSLKVLKIKDSDYCTTLELELLLRNSNKSLTEIHFEDVFFDTFEGLLEALTSSHSDLKVMEIHENEGSRKRYCMDDEPIARNKSECQKFDSDSWCNRPRFLTSPQIKAFNLSLPNITELKLDFDGDLLQNGHELELQQMVEALASNRNLKHLTLHFEYASIVRIHEAQAKNGSQYLDRWEESLLNTTSVAKLFQMIRRKQLEHGLNKDHHVVENMTVLLGHWEGKGRHRGGPVRLYGRFNCDRTQAAAYAVAGIEDENIVCTGGLTSPTLSTWDDYWP